MSKVPIISINLVNAYTGQQNRTGTLCNAYAPLKNLEDDNSTLGDFTTESLNFDLLHPVDIILQDSYDGAVNMLLNDGKNTPKLINSRFSVVDNNEFKIPVHTGHKNTNIYEEKTFDIDTSLKAIAQKIPQIRYEGLTQFAGSLLCGAYTFYFKLADADGNESEVLAESGLVQVYIGGNSEPDVNVRMGMEDENTGKAINFTLTNLDTGFDYVHVLYARSSSGNDQAAADTYHKILFDYPISNGECKITITGQELIIGISAEELYTDYADIESVKTQAVVNNVLFFGNIKKQEHDWDALRRASWKIGYSCKLSESIGSVDRNYRFAEDEDDSVKGCYYNTFNTYYRVGYWPDEIYRFGIVYIFEDNSLSPVFNLLGADLSLFEEKNYELKGELLFNLIDKTDNSSVSQEWENSPDDYYFNKATRQNSKGVIKFPNLPGFKRNSGGIIIPKPLYIEFDLSYIGSKTPKIEKDDVQNFLKKHKIKGYFFVRQTRIPTILAQGLAIGLTKKDNGALPVIKQNNVYSIQSFLNNSQVLYQEGKTIQIPGNNVTVNALLIPDAELSEATYNLLFVANEYALIRTGHCSFGNDSNTSYVSKIGSAPQTIHKRKLLNVPEDFKSITDGEVYFSTLAGSASEPYKTSDVKYVWNETNPYYLTTSQSVVRGQWGCFVGVGENDNESSLIYGSIYNIKKANYADDYEAAVDLDFQLRMEREDAYRAICDRTEFSNELSQVCYRGDCFQSLYTHRMFRNFIDPELPTNDKIISPLCWAQNYAVRCTAIANMELEYNVYPENDGWNVSDLSQYANEVTQAFEVKEENETNEWHWDPINQHWYKGSEDNPDEIAEQLGGDGIVSDYIAKDTIRVVKPSEQESSGIGGVIKNIFKSNKWALRGLASINRADVNAVGLGQWITFPICSAKNLALRDIDYSNATEQASFNRKRSFYPLQEKDTHNPLRDSNVINQAACISIPHKKYYIIPDVPFIKQEYFTRVLNSLRDSAESITNEFKVMLEAAYRDYTKIHGPITKLVPLGSKMLVVFHHGLGVLALNEQMSQAENALGYLPAELNMTISPDYGSMWKDSIIETPKGIYGVDTVAKVIWKVVPSDAPQLQLISNFKIEKFLIDNINLSEFTTSPFVGRINVKSHYNAFKQDVIFTYYNDTLYKFKNVPKPLSEYKITSDGYLLELDKDTLKWELTEYKGEKVKAYYDEDTGILMNYSKQIEERKENYDSTFKWATGKSWSICFNEVLEKFITFYDWIPVESENIDNIWFSFDREAANELVEAASRSAIKRYIEPVNDSKAGGRDENYGGNALDTTFNSTVSVTYFDQNVREITFEPTEYKYNKDKVFVAGLYLKNGANYLIEVSGWNVPQQVQLSEKESGWSFVTVKLYKESLEYDRTIKVSILGEDLLYSNFAVSDIITDNIENLEWISATREAGGFLVEIIPDSELPLYYTVRTLTDSLPLWKHGFAGLYDNADEIKPTFWYGQQHEFNFEFIARKDAMHKIFNNLQIISNKAAPHKFEFEIVGEAYEWHKYKSVLKQIADKVTVATDNPNYKTQLDQAFKDVLSTGKYQKLPYLTVTDACVPTLDPQIIGEKKPIDKDHSDNTVACCLVYDKQLNEFRVHTEQLGNDMWKYGRLKGNMQYLEDLWRIEIRPVSFKWVYLEDGELVFSRIQETRHRDKYIKIKVRYSGEDLAVIQAINTLFDYSYA